MNKKINLGMVIILLFLIIMVTGAIIYSKNSNKNQAKVENKNVDLTKNKINPPGIEKDSIFIDKADGMTYEMSLATKESKIAADKNIDPASFAGLPKETDNVSNSISLFSKDEKKVLVVSITFDLTKKPSTFDGSYPIVSGAEFICDIATKACLATDAFDFAYKATGLKGNWYDQYPDVEWYEWDSNANILYGYSAIESGNTSPVYTFSINDKTLKKTPTNVSDIVPAGAFSPTLSKFVVIDSASSQWSLLLYSSSNLSAPLKKIDVSEMKDAEDDGNIINSIAWSQDEKNIVLASDNEIYKLNLDSGAIVSIFVDESEDVNDPGIDSSAIVWSLSGKYVVFVDYDNGNQPYDENKSYTVLKAIDLENNNNMIELLREEDISLRI